MQLLTLTEIENLEMRTRQSNRSNTYEFQSANEFHESSKYGTESLNFEGVGTYPTSRQRLK